MYRDATNVEHEMYDYTVIIGATRTVKSLKKNLEVIPGKRSVDSVQKTAVLGTSHIIQKILQSETLKPERWGSLLVKEEYQGKKKACDKRQQQQQQQQRRQRRQQQQQQQQQQHNNNRENSAIGHCTHTAESANVKVQNILHGRNNITCSTNCKYRTAATLCTLDIWFVSGI